MKGWSLVQGAKNVRLALSAIHLLSASDPLTFGAYYCGHQLDELREDDDDRLRDGVLASIEVLDAVVRQLLGHLAKDLEGRRA